MFMDSNIRKNRSITCLYIFTVSIWFLRMVLPGIKYIFIPAVFLLLVFSVIYFKRTIFNKLLFIEYIKTFYPLIILGVFYIIGILFSRNLYNICLKDMTELLVALFFLYFLFISVHGVHSVQHLKQIFRKITSLIGVFSVLAAVLGLMNLALKLQGIEIVSNSIGSSLNMDVNFYALFSFLGIISFLPILIKPIKPLKRTYIQSVLFVLILNIFFSYSARSLFLLGVTILLLILLQLVNLKKGISDNIKSLSGNTRVLTYILLILICGLFVIFKHTTFIKENITPVYSDYQSVFSASEKDNYANFLHEAFKTEKLTYAYEIFRQQSFLQKLFGNGFLYLEKFGERFYNNPGKLDYPHNPILSSLLYSGMVGSLFVLSFLLISLYYGLIYIRKYPLFSLMLFISLVFIFFSGNSIFSVPIFLFLFSLSFLIRHQEITDLKIDYNLKKSGSKLLKEVFDYMVATVFIIILSPVLFIVFLVVLFSMGWPVIYNQTRIGQNGKTFRLHKFRTMKNTKSTVSVAASEKERITPIGIFLRKTKLDELPELWNIIRGDMSFVGPRPDVSGYADLLKGEDKIILQLKPGLTGPASLKYVDEDELLINQPDPQRYNDEVIFPDKVEINKAYMKYWTFWLDIKIIIFTLLRKRLNEEYFQ